MNDKGEMSLSKMKKHCSTCKYSYFEKERDRAISPDGAAQHCSNTCYNSPQYTHEHLMEDWGKGHCRFWSPLKGETKNEKQLLDRPT